MSANANSSEEVVMKEFIAHLRSGNNVEVEIGLKSFVDAADSFTNTWTGQDVVHEYLTQSEKCSELLTCLSSDTKLQSAVVSLVFRILELIFRRTADDLVEYESVGSGLMHVVLGSHLKTFYWMFGQKKSNLCKTALLLLTSMVSFSKQAAKDLLAYFKFDHPYVQSLLTNTDIKKPDDVRSCYILFLLSFLDYDDNNITRKMVTYKGLLNAVFRDIKTDKCGTIQTFLSRLLSKVVENPTLSKTSKVGVINDFTLKLVLDLYRWAGPQSKKAKKKTRKDKAAEQVAEEDTVTIGVNESLTDEQILVRDAAHQFLLAVCCYRKQGIIFYDSSVGTSGKNFNHMITILLQKVEKPYESEYMRELVVRVLCASPDQLRHYLPCLKHTLEPRPSSQWVAAVHFVQEVYDAQDALLMLKNLPEKLPLMKLSILLSVINIPPTGLSRNMLMGGLTHDVLGVRHVTLEFLLTILKRVSKLESLLRSAVQQGDVSFLVESDILPLIIGVCASLRKVVPDCSSMKACWDRAFGPETTSDIILPSEELPRVSLVEHLEVLLEVRMSLGKLLPEWKQDQDFSSLLSQVQDVAKRVDRAEVAKFQIKVIELVATLCDFEAFLASENSLHNVVHSLTLIAATADVSVATAALARRLLLKVLAAVNLSVYLEEMYVWVHWLSSEDVAASFTAVVTSYAQNQDRYLRKAKKCSTEWGNVAELAITNRGFSPLVFVALEVLSGVGYTGDSLNYVSNVFQDILHMQYASSGLQFFMSHAVPTPFYKYCKMCNGSRKYVDCAERGFDFKSCMRVVFESRVGEPSVDDQEAVSKAVESLSDSDSRLGLYQGLFYLSVVNDADEFPGKKDLVAFFCQSVYELATRLDRNPTGDSPEDSAVSLPYGCIVALRHPVFLNSCISLGSTKKREAKLAKIVTRFVTKLLGSAKEVLSSTPVIGELLRVYQKEVFNIITERLNACDSNMGSTVFLTRELLELLIGHFSAQEVTTVLENSSGCAPFADYEVYKLIVKMGLEIVARDRVPYVSASCFATHLMSACRDEELLKLFLAALKEFPAYSVCCPTELIDACFDTDGTEPTDVLRSIGALLVYQSPNHRTRFEKLCLDGVKGPMKLTLPLSASYTAAIAQLHPELSGDTMSTTLVVFENYFSCIQEVLHCLDGAEILKDSCSLLKAWTALNIIGVDAMLKKLLYKMPQSVWPNILLHGSGVFLSLVQEMQPAVQKASTLAHVCLSTVLAAASDNQWKSAIVQQLLELTIKVVNAVKNKKLLKILDAEDSGVNWDALVKCLLKNGLSNKDRMGCLDLLCALSSKVYTVQEHRMVLPVAAVYEMIFGHSQFLTLMLSDEKSSIHKGKLLELLVALSALDPSVCHTNHVAVFLGSYKATLEKNDQILLYLLYFYEVHGADVVQYRPFLWGQAAITHYSIKKRMGDTLLNESRMEDIIVLLDKDRLMATALNFPLHLELEPYVSNTMPVAGDIYDPRFLLPILSHLLQPGAYVHCLKFIQSWAMLIAFASLSSRSSDIRAAGYHVLVSLEGHLEGARFGQKQVFVHLLSSVRNGINGQNPKLSSIVSTFLVKAFVLLLTPEDPMYNPISSYLLIKPALDLHHVPEFLKLFNSSDIQHHKHRRWSLSLLADGIREPFDVYICGKSHVLKIILAFSNSPLCDRECLVRILSVLHSAVKIPVAARKLVANRSILAYLHGLWLKKGAIMQEMVPQVVSLLHTTWTNLLIADEGADWDEASSETQGSYIGGGNGVSVVYKVEFFVTLQALLDWMSDLDHHHWKLFLETLASVTSHLDNHKQNSNSAVPNLSLSNVRKLLLIQRTFQTPHPVTSKEQLDEVSSADDGQVDLREPAAKTDPLTQVLLQWMKGQVRDSSIEVIPKLNGGTRASQIDSPGSEPTHTRCIGSAVAEIIPEVLSYLLQNVRVQQPDCVQLLQCVESLQTSGKTNCLLNGTALANRNLNLLFDLYNRWFSENYRMSHRPSDEQTKSIHVLVLAQLNRVFLEFLRSRFQNGARRKVSKKSEPSDRHADVFSFEQAVECMLDDGDNRTRLEQLCAVQNSLDDSEENKKIEAVLGISKFVCEKLLRKVPSTQEDSPLVDRPKKRRKATDDDSPTTKRRK